MGMEFIITKMEIFMKGINIMISKMDMEILYLKIKIYLKVYLKMIYLKMVFFIFMMVVDMKVNSIIIK